MSVELYQKAKKQELINKHAKFFAAGKNAPQTQFQGIHYVEDGTAYVTDGHVLLRIKNVSPFAESHTLHAITGAELEGDSLPQETLDKLFRWNPENRILLQGKEQIEEATRYAKIARMIEKELKKTPELVELTLVEDLARLETFEKDFDFQAVIGNPQFKQAEENWTFNANYLYNTFNLFRDFITQSLTIKVRHKYDPITFSDEENGIDILILPIRRG